jgi:adenylate cyclase
MPAPIADRLKAGEERIADRIDTLSVMFADLVGYTESVHKLPPEEVVDFLDRLVRVFDGLSQHYGVEKIKTIGDSYMAAAGFDGHGPRARVATGRLALDMLDAIGRQPPLGGRAPNLRIGIHSGPATAGVIGDTRFSYDVWGECREHGRAHGIERQAGQDPRQRKLSCADTRTTSNSKSASAPPS